MHDRVWILTLFSLLSSAPAYAKWDLNDVSYLYPLPKRLPQEHRLLMRPDQSGRFGQLLPARIVQGFYKLVEGPQTYAELYANLRVVGARIDPCFKFDANRTCLPQLRLVWQPLAQLPSTVPTESSGEVVADDAAMHTFYNLSNAEFQALTTELSNFKRENAARTAPIKTDGRALGVHPALADPRTRMESADSLNRIFLKYAGYGRLTRVTQMRLAERGRHWHFEGIDRIASGGASVIESWRLISIPRAGKSMQDLFHEGEAVPPASRKGYTGQLEGQNLGMWTVFPIDAAREEEDLMRILLGFFASPGVTKEQDQELRNHLEFVDALEDPTRHDTTTMDCVHCHVAQPVKQWVKSQVPSIADAVPFVARGHRAVLAKEFNLKNVSGAATNTKNFRAFGYFGSIPSVSDRAIMESADVARTLNQ